MVEWLKIISCAVTVLIGAAALFAPQSITGFTGLNPNGSRGLAELRAIFGGVFITLGFAPLLIQKESGYKILGLTYLGIAIARTFSLIIDRSFQQSNIISVVSEYLLAAILILL